MQTPTHAPYISLLQLFKRPSMVISSLKNPFPFEFLELLVDFSGLNQFPGKTRLSCFSSWDGSVLSCRSRQTQTCVVTFGNWQELNLELESLIFSLLALEISHLSIES